MIQYNQQIKKTFGLVSVICGSLALSLPAIAQTTPNLNNPNYGGEVIENKETPSGPQQQLPPGSTVPSLNPTPSPMSVPAPQQVPSPSSDVAPTNQMTSPLGIPAPEQLQPPSATIQLMNGKVDVRLINQTGDPITYQVIGDTNERTLQGRSNVTLQALNAPTSITFQRPNGGLIEVIPQPSAELGMLEVTLVQTTDLSIDKNAMTIQESGNVFLN